MIGCPSATQTARNKQPAQPRHRRMRVSARRRPRDTRLRSINGCQNAPDRRLLLVCSDTESTTSVDPATDGESDGAGQKLGARSNVHSRLRARLVARCTEQVLEVLKQRHGSNWVSDVLQAGFHVHETMLRLCEGFGLRPALEAEVLREVRECARQESWNLQNASLHGSCGPGNEASYTCHVGDPQPHSDRQQLETGPCFRSPPRRPSSNKTLKFATFAEVCFFVPDDDGLEGAHRSYDRSILAKPFDGPSGHKARKTKTDRSSLSNSGNSCTAKQGDGDSIRKIFLAGEWQEQCDEIAELMVQERHCLLWSPCW
eukprot:CAMPEP_0172827644 /NCGR_PEP_ID=MMETSP1075-20121228/20249_1 /TAXON_ID=2916 /ORGANISM="Ceratium fusus, Strain PA161109" /LENGTH=314 /DNA_ID=CAMNT_0013669485 /DNA_START=1 /DNA_END=945 /DNA_ORIENTATION=-